MEKYVNVTVPYYSEAYQVSDTGNVKSIGRYVDNKGTLVFWEGRILKPNINTYRRNERSVELCYNGVKKRYKVHYLVALAFPEICGEYFEGAEVDHKNGDPTDNRAVNLHWVDRKGNMANPVTRKRQKEFWNSEKGEELKKMLSEKMKGEKNPSKRKKNISKAVSGRNQVV